MNNAMNNTTNSIAKILWVDDEVELLKPHIMFLRARGYDVDTCNNGYDAIEMVQSKRPASPAYRGGTVAQ